VELKTARGTLALLHLEDDSPDVLFEQLPGAKVPLWSVVRSQFIVALQNQDFGHVPLPYARSIRFRTWGRIARSLMPSKSDVRAISEAREVLYLVGGGTTYEVGGHTRNWLVGDFIDQYPDRSALIQWSPIVSPDPVFPFTKTLEPMLLRSGVKARFSHRNVDELKVQSLVREFADRLDSGISVMQVEAITENAIYAASTAAYREQAFASMLDVIEPRLVVMEDASYGAWGSLVSMMKAREVLVVEPQHGWIGPTHGAYNFGLAMHRPELSRTLPDELLTFGEYWGRGIRHPALLTAVGKPHLEMMASAAAPWSERPKEVLLVSSITDPSEMTRVAIAINNALPDDWTLRFRPHPSELPVAHAVYAKMLAVPGIELDDASDVYDSLARSRGIVGVASTVLFEGLAMGCRVFALASELQEYYVGDIFGPTIDGPNGVGEFVKRLNEDSPDPLPSLRDDMWKPKPLENFSHWATKRFGW
jgi:hypothetical protein